MTFSNPVRSEERWRVGVLVFPEVEVLDFAGPFEVFSRARLRPGAAARRDDASAPFDVWTVAKHREVLAAVGGLEVRPSHGFEDSPPIDILVVPGGFGTRPLLDDEATLSFIARTASTARRTTSVCTGALLLARAGLLEGKRVTTHWLALDELERLAPDTATIERELRVVDDGIVSSAGVAAGIDMALHVVATICGQEVAEETARYIEYPWPRAETVRPRASAP